MSRRRRKQKGKPTGGGGARNPNSLANLIPGAGQAGVGNTRRNEHGGYAAIIPSRLREKEREVYDVLSADLPLREADGSAPATDALVVSLLAETLCRLDSVKSFVNRRGFEDDKGEVRPAVTLETRLRDQGLAIAKELGMTPASRARLGLDLIRAAGAAEDEAANRAARDRLDRRFAGLDRTAQDSSVDGGQKVRDEKQKPSHGRDSFAPSNKQDLEANPDQGGDEPREACPAAGLDEAGAGSFLEAEDGGQNNHDARHHAEDAITGFVSKEIVDAQDDQEQAETDPKDALLRKTGGVHARGISAERPTE